MKVTVTFGDTAVVVPCKAGWTVRDLVDQATRRYRRILEQHGQCAVKTHHLEYAEGGILDVDDMLIDLVEDRDKLVAVFDEVQAGRTASPSETMSNGYSSSASPEPLHYFPHLDYKEPIRGEIEVNEAVLKANTPLLVRSSSDSALAPTLPTAATPTPDENGYAPMEAETNNGRLRDLNPLPADGPRAKMSRGNFSLTRTVKFPGDWGPLGIHVVPYCSSLSGRTLGLHIKGIEKGSLAKKENLFLEDECIVQINNVPLQDKTFAQSQDVFRQAMATPSVQLEILSVANRTRYEKGLIGQLFTGDGKDLSAKTKSPMLVRAKANPQPEPKGDKLSTKLEVRQPDVRSKTPEPDATIPPLALQSGQDSQERVSPTALAPQTRTTSTSPTPKVRSQSPLVAKSPVIPGLPNLTSKKGGKRIKIDLKKGAEGLGFTVVTRDSSVHEPGPILVKNILQRGAAVKDGRLQPGDRILEVNGVDMTGRSQEELVAMLRSTKQGESVSVVVARQEDLFLPRELKGEDAGSLVLEDGREQLMYEIPLNETGSAGLGVSLKGNKSRETGEDLGIFIKSIIHGGAAYKDGRLSVNDQLIAINGESLLGRSNHAAMETLRRSMSSEGNSRGTIQLVVLRAPHQMASSSPAPSTSTNGSAANQPSTLTGFNQVGVGDPPPQQLQPPPTPPRRSSSFFPMLRRRASEPLPHSCRAHTQKPVETNPRHTYDFSQRHGGYMGSFMPGEYGDDGQNDVYTAAVGYDSGFFPYGGKLSSYKRSTEANLNRESYNYGGTQSRAFAHSQDRTLLQNTDSQVFYDAQGNTRSRRLGRTRSHTSDSIHTHDGYTENIRAMAGQMYGDPPAHGTRPTRTDLNRNAHTPADRYAHSHNHTHDRALIRHHHLRFSGGL